jgi:AcrR family transcriptional regulator
MDTPSRVSSQRERDLLESAYEYVLKHGLTNFSLRPLALAIGSSPRVLLFLFGSKEGLVKALLNRARGTELVFLGEMSRAGAGNNFPEVVRRVWQWLSDKQQRPMLALWLETYAHSIVEPEGPYADFARKTVQDWLELLAAHQPAQYRRSRAGEAERALALAVLRGSLMDLLATGDEKRTTAIVEAYILGR